MTPQLIGTLTFPSTQPANFGRLGPYVRTAGDFAYVVCCEIASAVAKPNLVVYKTPAAPDPNFEIVWTRVAAGPIARNDRASVFYIGTGDVIHIGYKADDLSVSHISFDMAAETFSSPDIVDAGGAFGVNIISVMLVELSSGDLVCAYDDGGVGVFVQLFTLGSWSGRITVSGAASARFNHAVIVDDTNIKLLWYTIGGTNLTSFSCSTFDGVSAITGTSTAYTSAGSDFTSQVVEPGVYDAGNDRVGWNIVNIVNGNQENQIILISGQASSAAPAFTSTLVYEDLDTTDSISATVQLVPSTGGFTTAFILAPGTGNPDQVYTCTSATLDGTWSVPALYYDLNTDPPTPAPTNNTIFPLWSLELSDGTPAFLIGLTQDIETVEFCGVIYALPVSVGPPTTQTLELTKIVSGGPAVPGDWTLTGTGGSPETSITGAGHVGPSEVNPGTYELEESGGPGAVWDGAVWDSAVWGGTYAPGAWDCGDAEMPTPTSVIVPEGGAVACQIVNTFIPTPPPPPPSGGTLNAVGCWELLRLDVTLMPSRHLPTRGSVR